MTFLEIRMRDDQACLSASVCICCLFCSAFLLPLFDCEKDKHRCIKAASVSLSWLTSYSLSLSLKIRSKRGAVPWISRPSPSLPRPCQPERRGRRRVVSPTTGTRHSDLVHRRMVSRAGCEACESRKSKRQSRSRVCSVRSSAHLDP